MNIPSLFANAALGLLVSYVPASFAEFRQTSDAATIAFEGPSAKATKQFVYSRGTPLDVIVQIEGWAKVRDAQGSLVWVERKALTERSFVQIKAPIADVYSSADMNNAVAFRAENGVLLQLVSPPSSGWVQVRHRDGQTGYIRAEALFGV